ncbi:MAG: hypothetical protein R3281_09130 [Balneolaceae bacterium]|nr:hypothetical protein [Balneolaceae bacterium]
MIILFTSVPLATHAQQTDTTAVRNIYTLKAMVDPERQLYFAPPVELPVSGGFYGNYDPLNTTYKTGWRFRWTTNSLVYALNKVSEQQDTSRFLALLQQLDPYINNVFEFGYYQINDLPIIDRKHPYFNGDIREYRQENRRNK